MTQDGVQRSTFNVKIHARHIYFKLMTSVLISVGNSMSNSGINTSRLLQCLGLSSSSFSSIIGMLETYQILAASFFGCILLFRQLKKSRSTNPKGLPFLPGPKGYPLIGSLFNMPIDKPWLIYDKWRKITANY